MMMMEIDPLIAMLNWLKLTAIGATAGGRSRDQHQ